MFRTALTTAIVIAVAGLSATAKADNYSTLRASIFIADADVVKISNKRFRHHRYGGPRFHHRHVKKRGHGHGFHVKPRHYGYKRHFRGGHGHLRKHFGHRRHVAKHFGHRGHVAKHRRMIRRAHRRAFHHPPRPAWRWIKRHGYGWHAYRH
ncbi:MAG: hypothetical protein AAF330_06640 [Pseudomonadota bacterium]